MKKKILVLSLSLLSPGLFGCKDAKMHEPHFRNYGSIADLNYIWNKLVSSFMQSCLSKSWSFNSLNSYKIKFNIEEEEQYHSNNLAYTESTSLSGSARVDSANQRLKMEASYKTFIKNDGSYASLEASSIKEGAVSEKTRVYGEMLNGTFYLVNREFGTVESYPVSSTNSLDNYVPYFNISDFIDYDLSGSSNSTTGYINGNRIFKIVSREASTKYSGHSYYLDTIYQYIIGKKIRVLCKSIYVDETSSSKTMTIGYGDVILKQYKGTVGRVSYKI